uniref:CD276 antigen homolog isoform X2 n=1 Tax=Scatophagus argus TaxID=75038 RepID=UPI001ED8494E|nr:CD276 antigen homolog isoform X2 [Scatophagus argus]
MTFGYCGSVGTLADAILVQNVNTSVGQSTLLNCTLMSRTPIGLKNLRFYWQDDRQLVLYSFNEGKEMPEHVDQLYGDRVTAFRQDMTTGNMSVLLKNPTLRDDQRVFKVFAAVFHTGTPRRYIHDHEQICEITLHVGVPYRNVSVALNEEREAAVCTAQGGFPEPLVTWKLQHLASDFQRSVDVKDVHTTAVQNHQDHLYSCRSTMNVTKGQDQAVTCFVHNPTLNETSAVRYTLNNGAAERSFPFWAGGLMNIALLVFVYVTFSL